MSSSASSSRRHGRSHSDPVSPSSENPPLLSSSSSNVSVQEHGLIPLGTSRSNRSDLFAPTPMTLTSESLARLGLSDDHHFHTNGHRNGGMEESSSTTLRIRWPLTNDPSADGNGNASGSGSGGARGGGGGGGQSPLGRLFSATPSVTSVSDDEDRAIYKIEEEAKSWLLDNRKRDSERRGGKGKGKMRVPDGTAAIEGDGNGIAGTLPPEILIQIFRLLPNPQDLVSSLLVSRSWCLCAFSLLWYKPTVLDAHTLAAIIRVLSSETSTNLPYANAVRRLHLTQLGWSLTDELLRPLASCTRVERLTLTGAYDLSASALMHVIDKMPELSSADLSEIESVDDDVVVLLAERCKKLQAVNLSCCKLVGDRGVSAMAEHDKLLKRVKLVGCHRVTEKSLIPLVQSCTLILEIDLQDVISISDATVHSIFLHLAYLREIRLNGCVQLTENCIPNLARLIQMSDDELVMSASEIGLSNHSGRGNGPRNQDLDLDLQMLRPSTAIFDSLRLVDMTGCTSLGDKAVENLIHNAPKLRTLTLTKCGNLTDRSLESIGKLGKHLHHLHLGHVKLITDDGVARLARSCTRLRYIDLACCDLLTDRSVCELGVNMPKLRRVGLVKVVNITDDAIYALVERHTALERVHLSYCDKLSVKAITFLLNRLRELKHLSLTGVTSFKVRELQQFCRAPPENFNDHQRAAFCVFSGEHVTALRKYLNEHLLAAGLESDVSTRRGSGSSSSSITIPGGPSPPPYHIPVQPPSSTYSPSLIFRRGSVPILRDRDRDSRLPGLPTAAFVNGPNFLSPTLSLPPPSPQGSRNGAGRPGRTVPGGYQVRSVPAASGDLSHPPVASNLPSRLRDDGNGNGSGFSSRSSSSSTDDTRRRTVSPSINRHTSSANTTTTRDRPNGPRRSAHPVGVSDGGGGTAMLRAINGREGPRGHGEDDEEDRRSRSNWARWADGES
ncbi:hypothetical protein IAR55_006429 [Kwoniella newhampshirensis]|uniref:F-box domain-containing protein n=1 Tax=Kwoniella newhampshirensis TaxID=1651941 RepID=A0AAW0YWZ1_9TREE